MSSSTFRKVWGSPILLGIISLFGLLAALLGTGYWTWLAWTALTVPLLVIIWKTSSRLL